MTSVYLAVHDFLTGLVLYHVHSYIQVIIFIYRIGSTGAQKQVYIEENIYVNSKKRACRIERRCVITAVRCCWIFVITFLFLVIYPAFSTHWFITFIFPLITSLIISISSLSNDSRPWQMVPFLSLQYIFKALHKLTHVEMFSL